MPPEPSLDAAAPAPSPDASRALLEEFETGVRRALESLAGVTAWRAEHASASEAGQPSGGTDAGPGEPVELPPARLDRPVRRPLLAPAGEAVVGPVDLGGAPSPTFDPDAARALIEEFEAGVARAMRSAGHGEPPTTSRELDER